MNSHTILAIFITILFLLYTFTFDKKGNEKLNFIKNKLINIDVRASDKKFYIHNEESFTLGKNEIYMCVKDSNGQYYDDNILMYIALHELAHSLIPEDTSHHPPQFDDMFKKLKQKAIYLGLYDPSVPFPSEYCGKQVSYY